MAQERARWPANQSDASKMVHHASSFSRPASSQSALSCPLGTVKSDAQVGASLISCVDGAAATHQDLMKHLGDISLGFFSPSRLGKTRFGHTRSDLARPVPSSSK